MEDSDEFAKLTALAEAENAAVEASMHEAHIIALHQVFIALNKYKDRKDQPEQNEGNEESITMEVQYQDGFFTQRIFADESWIVTVPFDDEPRVAINEQLFAITSEVFKWRIYNETDSRLLNIASRVQTKAVRAMLDTFSADIIPDDCTVTFTFDCTLQHVIVVHNRQITSWQFKVAEHGKWLPARWDDDPDCSADIFPGILMITATAQ